MSIFRRAAESSVFVLTLFLAVGAQADSSDSTPEITITVPALIQGAFVLPFTAECGARGLIFRESLLAVKVLEMRADERIIKPRDSAVDFEEMDFRPISPKSDTFIYQVMFVSSDREPDLLTARFLTDSWQLQKFQFPKTVRSLDVKYCIRYPNPDVTQVRFGPVRLLKSRYPMVDEPDAWTSDGKALSNKVEEVSGTNPD